jgi:hypothetical protein
MVSDLDCHESWDWLDNPVGPHVISDIGNGWHLPIYTLTAPVELTDEIELRFMAPSMRWFARDLRKLVKLQAVEKSSAARILRSVADGEIRDGNQVTVPIQLPMRLEPAPAAGRHFLYIDTHMPMRQSVKLAHALFGLVDEEHIRDSRHNKRWIVNVGRRPASAPVRTAPADQPST